MFIVFRCPCDKKLVVKREYIGKQCVCPQCGVRSVVPEHSTEEPTPQQSAVTRSPAETSAQRPTSRRPVADDTTDTPRRSSRQAATPEGSSKAVVLLAVFALAGVLLLCGGGGFATWFFFFRSSPSSTQPSSSSSDDSLAARNQEANNLKQIGLALHNYHADMGTFPAAALYDANGKPLLSWRVAILPFIEENALYEQIHLDEPWDSLHNMQVAKKMPEVFACPYPGDRQGVTRYRVFTGDQAAFPDRSLRPSPSSEGRKIWEFTDGTSNTLLVVVADEAVPWMKPEELPYAPELPLPRLGSQASGFQVLFADGDVRYLRRRSIDDKTLRALITPNGGEIVDLKD